MKKSAIIFVSLFTLTLTLKSPAFAQLGTIKPPADFKIPTADANPSVFVATLVRNGITLLLVASFVIALIWIILNGLRFILAQGDEKTVASAWTQIYWTLIGMVIIMGSFAIIKMVETFFGVSVLSADLKLPHLPQ
ncbi:MAG: hypothetical protein Q7S45_02515 [Candidatus Curtissbacteria bacterium]|nr:hypothetical protein [Candidatus Curtissbacteria bacterium]